MRQKSGESKIANILWNTGDTTNTITTPDYGIYKVTITDVNGCTASDSIWIENKPFRAWANVYIPSCHGLNDGSISLSALDGVFPYRYKWGNGGTVSTIDNLSAGSYSYTITDSRGCQIDDTIIIDEPDSLVIFQKKSNLHVGIH
ncbi:MAG: SprB repeat-containing protein [Saprospiraceae bacterium]|nr:SprB repeat-containing protein [Saprospiraceae bacterium]